MPFTLEAAIRHHRALDEDEQLDLELLTQTMNHSTEARHLTASALLLNEDGRVLIHQHKRLGLWLLPGGHIENQETVAEAAAREALEETGYSVRPDFLSQLVYVNSHAVGANHEHVDVCVLFRSGNRVSQGEGQPLRWASEHEVHELAAPRLAQLLGYHLPRCVGEMVKR